MTQTKRWRHGLKGKGSNVRIERRTLADGSVKEYRYTRKQRAAKHDQTVRGVIAAWQHSIEWDALSPGSSQLYTRYLHPLFEAMGSIAAKKVRRRNLMAIRDHIAKSRGHGAALSFCRTVGALFAWAVDREIVEMSPAMRIRKGLHISELPTWTQQQAALAMRELPEPYRRVVVLAYHTGQRRSDLCAMRWSDYDGAALHITQIKTKARLAIPVTPQLKAELETWKREARTLTILESPMGVPWANQLSWRLSKRLVETGLPKGLNLHGLRKLAAVRLAEAGCSAHETAAITGHTTLAMVQLYTKAVNQRTLADVAVLRLDTRHKDPKWGKK